MPSLVYKPSKVLFIVAHTKILSTSLPVEPVSCAFPGFWKRNKHCNSQRYHSCYSLIRIKHKPFCNKIFYPLSCLYFNLWQSLYSKLSTFSQTISFVYLQPISKNHLLVNNFAVSSHTSLTSFLFSLSVD